MVGGEGSYQMESLISHRESIFLCSHPASRDLVSLSPFWRTVKKEHVNKVNSSLHVFVFQMQIIPINSA